MGRQAASSGRPRIFTVGHSTHPVERFLELLADHQIATVADVRSFPSSRRWPQFNRAELERSLAEAGVEYRWLRLLGGRRRQVREDSPHTAWTHPAFRSYADYTDTADFEAGIEDLMALASQSLTAYLCAEGLWWRCHRRIISDVLIVRGWRVDHIMPNGELAEHALPEFARVSGHRLIYDGGQPQLNLK